MGARYVLGGVKSRYLTLGASHARGLRADTENGPHIVGLGAVCAIAERILADAAKRERELRDAL